jgi:ectoine hydroxylase-related dioxygenase (phytanoyl-CoA dioxygenase family)
MIRFVLSSEQQRDFDRTGLLKLPGAVDVRDAQRMAQRVWEELERRHGIRRDARATWTMPRPGGLQALERSDSFAAMASPTVLAALDEVLGKGAWQAPRHWGRALVTFPNSDRWDVPRGEWHLDFDALPRTGTLPGIQVFVFLDPVSSCGGGTIVVAGSHRLVADFVAGGDPGQRGRSADVRKALRQKHPWLSDLWCRDDRSDRVARFMQTGAIVGGHQLQVVEMTGEPGDAILMHPWTFHAGSPNRRATPRLMLSQPIARSYQRP